MGCGSSTSNSAIPTTAAYAPNPRPSPSTTPTAGRPGGDLESNTIKNEMTDRNETTVPSGTIGSNSHVTIDDLLSGSLLLLQKVTDTIGMGQEIVTALTSIYQLWNSSHTKTRWCGEFMVYLQNIEIDLNNTKSNLTQPFYLQRITNELQAAQTTLNDILSPSTSFVIDVVRVPFLQQRLSEHRSHLEAIKQEALGSTLIDAALDVRQTKALITQLISDGDLTKITDPRDQLKSSDNSSNAVTRASDSALISSSSPPNSLTPQINQLFSIFGVIYDGYKRLQEALAKRNVKNGPNQLQPPNWIIEFVGYLHQVESELRQAQLLLEGAKNATSLASHIKTLTAALRHAKDVFYSISERQAPVDAISFSHFLQLLHVNSDRESLRAEKSAIETIKSTMLISVLTAFKVESQATNEMDQLTRYLAAQDQQIQEQRRITREKRIDDNILRVLTPIDSSAELKFEYRRFLHGTRQSVIELFKRFIGQTSDTDETASPDSNDDPPVDPIFQSPLFLLLSSPGHGKTTFSSYLVQNYSDAIIGVHFFKFDMNLRRNINRCIKSIVYQMSERIPGMKAQLKEALRKNGIEVEPPEENSTPNEKDGNSTEDDLERAPTDSSHIRWNNLDSLNTLELWDQFIVQPLWQLDKIRKEEREKENEQATNSNPTSSSNRPPRYIILFDALDESELNGNNLLLKLFGFILPDEKYALPGWVGIFVSSRPESCVTRVLAKFLKAPTTISLDVLDHDPTLMKRGTSSVPGISLTKQRSLEQPTAASLTAAESEELPPVPAVSDLRLFFTAVVNTFMPKSKQSTSPTAASSSAISQCIDLLLTKSQGMFLYGRLILEQYGLDLNWMTQTDELQAAVAKGEEPEGFKHLTLEAITSFPSGLNNFYLELLQRASSATTNTKSSSSNTSNTMAELKRILQSMIISMEPFTLLQMKEIVQYSSWEEVFRRTEPLRSIIVIKPKQSPDGTNDLEPANTVPKPTPTHTLQLFHKSIRDWFVSMDRLSERDEAVFFLDEHRATAQLIQRSWNELQANLDGVSSSAVSSGSVLTIGNIILPSLNTFPLSLKATCPILRVEDATLPSRVTANSGYASSFLAYAIHYLPAHILLMCQQAKLDGEALTNSSDATVRPTCVVNLQILMNVLCHLQYVQMRLNSYAVLSGSLNDNIIKDSDAPEINPEASQLVKEFSMAILFFSRLMNQRQAVLDIRPSQKMISARGSSMTPTTADTTNTPRGLTLSDPTILTFHRSLRLLRSFQRFFRGEYPKLTVQPIPQCIRTSTIMYYSTLVSIYQYAESYPETHHVTQLCRRLHDWLQKWKRTVSEESAIVAVRTATELNPANPLRFARVSTPLVSGWVSWLNKPSTLSNCVAVVPNVGPVTSLVCASVPQPPHIVQSGSLLPTSTLFAVGQNGGTYSIYDLETLTVLWADQNGKYLAFDQRPEEKSNNSEANENAGEDTSLVDSLDDRDPPFYLIGGDKGYWSCMDLSSLNSGDVRTSNLNWITNTRGQVNVSGFNQNWNEPRSQWCFAPLHDRPLVVQYGSNNLKTETLLSNNGLCYPFPENDIKKRVVCVAFTHDGNQLFVSQDKDSMIYIFDCGPWSSGRPTYCMQKIFPQGVHGHATCLAFTTDDNILARGGNDGHVGLWRRERKMITRGTGENARTEEVSDYHFELMQLMSLPMYPRGVECIAVSETNLLVGFGAEVLLYDIALKRCIGLFAGHCDRIGGVAFSPDSRYGLSGGDGVDQTVRVWDLDMIDEAEAEKIDSHAIVRKLSSVVEAAKERDKQAKQDDELKRMKELNRSISIRKRGVRVCFFTGDEDETFMWNGNSGLDIFKASSLDSSHSTGPTTTNSKWQRAKDAAAANTSHQDAGLTNYSNLDFRPKLTLQVALLSPIDSKLLICGSEVQNLEVWDLNNMSLKHSLAAPPRVPDDISNSFSYDLRIQESLSKDSITSLCITDCGRFVLGGGYIPSIQIWRVSDGALIDHISIADHCPKTAIDWKVGSNYIMYDMDMIAISDTTYLLCIGVPVGMAQTFQIEFPVNESDSIGSSPKWQTQFVGESKRATARDILFYQPIVTPSLTIASSNSPSPSPLIFIGDTVSMIHILSSVTGAILYSFSTTPTMLPIRYGNDRIMRIDIIDQFGSAQAQQRPRRKREQAEAGMSTDGANSIQLVAANCFQGISIWQLDSLIQDILNPSKATTTSSPPTIAEPITTDLESSDSDSTVMDVGVSAPPPLVCLIRTKQPSSPLSSMAIDSYGHTIAVGCSDGSVFVYHWKPIEPLAKQVVPHWHGLFDFIPAQRLELTGLVASFDLSDATRSSSVVPPAARLVGIETNPGPVVLNPIPTLFNNGLHLIFSYLSALDWVSSMNTCHHWSSVGASAPPRNLLFTYQPAFSPCCLVLPPTRLARHSTRTIFCLFNSSELIALMSQLPHLVVAVLEVAPGMNSFVSSYEVESDQFVTFPSHLKILFVSMFGFKLPLLLSSIRTAAATLTSLTLQTFSPSDFADDDFGTMLNSLTHLTQLRITSYYQVRLESDFIVEWQLESLPSKLTSLNLSGGDEEIIRSLCLLSPLPNLTEFDLSSPYSLTPDIGEKMLLYLHQLAPNLTSLAPAYVYYSDFSLHLRLFQQLQRYEIANFEGELEESTTISSLISRTLGSCRSLTSISMDKWKPQSLLEWQEFASLEPQIRELNLTVRVALRDVKEGEFDLLDGLLCLPQLQKIRVYGEHDERDVEKFKLAFRNTRSFPHLTHLMIYGPKQIMFEYDLVWGINTHFRDATTPIPPVNSVPAKPLVGIETNPGPAVSKPNGNSASHPTELGSSVRVASSIASTLFMDGLCFIFRFLTFRGLIRSMVASHHWHSAGLKYFSLLTRLNLDDDIDINAHFTHLMKLKFPRLKQLPQLIHRNLIVSELQQLLTSMPNLQVLSPKSFLIMDLPLVTSFAHLKSLGIYDLEPSDISMENEFEALNVCLSQCPRLRLLALNVGSGHPLDLWTRLSATSLKHLTSLTFGEPHPYGVFDRASCWDVKEVAQVAVLFRGQLTHLAFDCDFNVDNGFRSIESLGSLLELTHLRIYQYCVHYDDAGEYKIIQFFESINHCPRLQHFYYRIYGDYDLTFDITPSKFSKQPIAIAPAPRLIGIELNPGPLDQTIEPSVHSPTSSSFTNTPTPTAQTLFVDGLLSIFSWLRLSDALAAFKSCHYWYDCGRKEKCRQLAVGLLYHAIRSTWPVETSNKVYVADLSGLLGSAFKFHVTAIHNMNIYRLLTHQSLELNHLQELECVFPRKPSNEIHPPMTSLSLPNSLTSMDIQLVGVCNTIDLCQSFLNALPQSASHLQRIVFSSPIEHQFDLSPFISLPALRHLTLKLDLGFTREYQRVCAYLPLTSFLCTDQWDWSTFYPESPLMMNIQELDWSEMLLFSADWDHLTAHPPPQLRRLTLTVDNCESFHGLPALHLNSLILKTRTGSANRESSSLVPFLQLCESLTTLKIVTIAGALFTEEQLALILSKLPRLIHFELNYDLRLTSGLVYESLPSTTIFDSLIVDSFPIFVHHLSRAIRMEDMTIKELTVLTAIPIEMATRDSLRSVCHQHLQRLTQPFQMDIKKMEYPPFTFSYQQLAHSTITTIPSDNCLVKELDPATDEPLDDIELQPVTRLKQVPSPPHFTVQTLWKGALYSIYRLLTPREFMASLRTCHHWSQCAYTAPSLQFEYFDLARLDSLDQISSHSPINHHITHYSDRSGRLVQFTPGLLVELSYRLSHLTSIDVILSNGTDIPDLTLIELECPFWPSQLQSLTIDWNSCRSDYPHLFQSICQMVTLTELHITNIDRPFSGFHPADSLAPLTQLTKLTLTTDYRPIKFSTILPVNVRDQLLVLPPSVTALNIDGPYLLQSEGFINHHLRQLHLNDLLLSASDIERLAQMVPDLEVLKDVWIRESDLHAIGQFHQLRTLEFRFYFDPAIYPAAADMSTNMIVCATRPPTDLGPRRLVGTELQKFTQDQGVPAARLVGIESNPGPTTLTSSDPASCESRLSVASPSPTPQTLFTDGIRSIYSFLTPREFAAAFKTCHLWHNTAVSAACLNFTFQVDMVDDELLIPHPPPFSLIHHFTSIANKDDVIPVRNSQQLTDVIQQFPSLTRLHSGIKASSWPLFSWPKQINDICLDLFESPLGGLFSGLVQLTALSKLQLTYKGNDWSRFHALQDLHHLTELRVSFNENDADIIQLASIDHLSSSLTALDLNSGSSFTSLVSSDRFRFPLLTDFALYANLQFGDLKKLHMMGPNISSLTPNTFCFDDFTDIALFRNLTEIFFFERLFEFEYDLEDTIISSLSLCPYLTSIQFVCWIPSKKSSWVVLAESCSKLKKLRCHWFGRKDPNLTLDILLPFVELEVINFHRSDNSRNIFQFGQAVGGVIQFFDLHHQLQLKKLRTVYVDYDQINGTWSAPVSPPADRLVGIETNPGHNSTSANDGLHNPIQAPTAQLLFKDGLHHIFSYLTQSEWFAAYRTCLAWSRAGESHSHYHLTLTIVKTDKIPPVPLNYRFISRIRTVHSNDTGVILRLSPLQQLIGHFPHLTSIHCRISANKQETRLFSKLSGALFRWPTALRSLDIDFRHSLVSDLVRPMSKLAHSLTSLRLDNYEGEIGSVLLQLQHLVHLILLDTLSDMFRASSYDNALNLRLQAWRVSPSSLPTSLAYLNILNGFQGKFIEYLSSDHLNLAEINTTQFNWKVGDLQRLLAKAPNLYQLQLSAPVVTTEPPFMSVDFGSDLDLLREFTHLTYLTLSIQPIKDNVYDTIDYVCPAPLTEMATLSLSGCIHLTHLSLMDMRLMDQTEGWSLLSQNLCQLTSLDLHCIVGAFDTLSFLLPFARQLLHLTIVGPINFSKPTPFLESFMEFTTLITLTLDFSNKLIVKTELLITRNFLTDHRQFPHLQVTLKYRLRTKNSNGSPETFIWKNKYSSRLRPTHSTPAHPPSTPLIGVELNPGPLAVTAQTLFTDGLRSIFQYLSLDDWLVGIRVCRVWFETACKSPSRQFQLDDLDVRRFCRSGCINSKLLYHIGRIQTKTGEYVAIDSISTLMRHCSQLVSLKTCIFNKTKYPESGVPSEHIFFSSTLLELDVQFISLALNSPPLPRQFQLTQAYLNGLSMATHLRRLSLYECLLIDLSVLVGLRELTHLSLTFQENVNQERSTHPTATHTFLTVLAQSLSSTCTHLDFQFALTCDEIRILHLPQVKVFGSVNPNHTEAYLQQLHQSMPNLVQLSAKSDPGIHYAGYPHFQSLTSLTITTSYIHPFNNRWSDESAAANELSRCVSLTHIGFSGMCFRSVESYEAIFQGTHLSSLSFAINELGQLLFEISFSPLIGERLRSLTIPDLADNLNLVLRSLSQFRSLTSLSMRVPPSETKLSHVFHDAHFLPKLTDLEVFYWKRLGSQASESTRMKPIEINPTWKTGKFLALKWNHRLGVIAGDCEPNFRVTVNDVKNEPVVTPPAPLLIGIETNPGPVRFVNSFLVILPLLFLLSLVVLVSATPFVRRYWSLIDEQFEDEGFWLAFGKPDWTIPRNVSKPYYQPYYYTSKDRFLWKSTVAGKYKRKIQIPGWATAYGVGQSENYSSPDNSSLECHWKSCIANYVRMLAPLSRYPTYGIQGFFNAGASFTYMATIQSSLTPSFIFTVSLIGVRPDIEFLTLNGYPTPMLNSDFTIWHQQFTSMLSELDCAEMIEIVVPQAVTKSKSKADGWYAYRIRQPPQPSLSHSLHLVGFCGQQLQLPPQMMDTGRFYNLITTPNLHANIQLASLNETVLDHHQSADLTQPKIVIEQIGILIQHHLTDSTDLNFKTESSSFPTVSIRIVGGGSKDGLRIWLNNIEYEPSNRVVDLFHPGHISQYSRRTLFQHLHPNDRTTSMKLFNTLDQCQPIIVDVNVTGKNSHRNNCQPLYSSASRPFHPFPFPPLMDFSNHGVVTLFTPELKLNIINDDFKLKVQTEVFDYNALLGINQFDEIDTRITKNDQILIDGLLGQTLLNEPVASNFFSTRIHRVSSLFSIDSQRNRFQGQPGEIFTTGTSKRESNSYQVHPPQKRLVGIELNPGPIGPTLSSMTHFLTRCFHLPFSSVFTRQHDCRRMIGFQELQHYQPSANLLQPTQTPTKERLYADVIHHIQTWLTLKELIESSRISKNWYWASQTLKTRQDMWLMMNHQTHLWNLIQSNLRVHIRRLVIQDPLCPGGLSLLGERMSHTTCTIHMQINSNNINTIHFSTNITDLTLEFGSAHSNYGDTKGRYSLLMERSIKLLASEAHQLTRLCIQEHDLSFRLNCLKPLTSMAILTDLTIPGVWSEDGAEVAEMYHELQLMCLKQLTRLVLAGGIDGDLEPLFHGCPSYATFRLREIGIFNRLDNEAASIARRLIHLTHLETSRLSYGVTDSTQLLPFLTQLTHLNIHSRLNVNVDDLTTALASCVRLRFLSVVHYTFKDHHFSQFLVDMTQLETLIIYATSYMVSLNFLAHITHLSTHLRRLSVVEWGGRFPLTELTHLLRLTTLHELEIDEAAFTQPIPSQTLDSMTPTSKQFASDAWPQLATFKFVPKKPEIDREAALNAL